MALLVGCDDDGGSTARDAVDGDTAETDGGETDGAWTVDVDEANGNWSVTPPGKDSAVLSNSFFCGENDRYGLQVGIGSPAQSGIAGQFRLNFEASSMQWYPVDCSELSVTQTEDTATITGSVDVGSGPQPVSLVISSYEDEHLLFSLETDADVDAGIIATDCRSSESYFGLGSQVIGMDLAGRTYPLWTQEAGIGKNDDPSIVLENSLEAAHAPLGIWHSTRGYSAVIGSDSFSELGLCDDNEMSVMTYADMPSFGLIAGDTPKDRLENITEIVGRITDPAPWTFGHWHDSVRGPDRLAYITETLREEGIPTSAIWTEDWIGATPNLTGFRLSYEWQWDDETYPNLPETIEDLHDRGFAFLGYFNPFVRTSVSHYEEGVENGYLIEETDGSVYTFNDPSLNTASWVDLTDPDARDWFKSFAVTAAETLKIDGWMADFAEWSPLDATYESGGNPYEFHNRYPIIWQEIQRDVLEAAHENNPEEAPNNWTFFARSGWASLEGGTPGQAQTMWAADQETDFSTGDGLPSVIPMGLHLGMAGVAIYGSDIAGYSSFSEAGNTTKELFFRWSTMSAFHPLMRTHHGSDNCENWSFDTDEETTDHFRRYARIHTLLYPYFDELSEDAMAMGHPMLRHPYLVEPARSDLWNRAEYQFFLGDDLLAAPVVSEATTTRTAYLPSEGWWPLFGSEPLDSASVNAQGNTVSTEVSAPATEIPVFVRPGTALFLLPEAVDTFYEVSVEGVSSLADVEGSYAVALYPDENGDASREYNGVAVQATGIAAEDPFSSITVDGSSLPTCSESGDVSCVSDDGNTAWLVGSSVEAALGDGTIQVTSDTEVRVRVGIGAAVWGELADPTPLTDLDPEGIEPFCREAEE